MLWKLEKVVWKYHGNSMEVTWKYHGNNTEVGIIAEETWK